MKLRFIVAVGAIALALVAAAGCSSGEGTITKTGETSTSAPTGDAGAKSTTEVPRAKTSDYSTNLPKTVTYGDLIWTIETGRVSDTIPSTSLEKPPLGGGGGLSAGTKAADGQAFALFDITIKNPLEDLDVSYPPAVIRLEVEGEDVHIGNVYALPKRVVNAQGLNIAHKKTEKYTLLYTVPEGTKLDDAELIIQEGAGDVDNERRPAVIPLTDEKATPTVKPIPLKGEVAQPNGKTICQGFRIEWIRGDLRDDLGLTDRGSTLNIGSRRAPTGKKFLVAEVNGFTVPVNTCPGSVVDGVAKIRDTSGNVIAETISNWGTCLARGYSDVANPCAYVFEVPEDFTSGVLEILNYGGDAGPLVKVSR